MRIFTASLIALLLSAFCQAAGPASDHIAAVVNGDIIAFSQVCAQSAPDVARLRQTEEGEKLLDAIKTARTSVLNRLIDRLVLLQELNKHLSVPLPASTTNEEIDSIIRGRFQGDRQKWLNQFKHKAYIRTFGSLLEDCPPSDATSNQTMKPTASLRCVASVFATTPCRGLSLFR